MKSATTLIVVLSILVVAGIAYLFLKPKGTTTTTQTVNQTSGLSSLFHNVNLSGLNLNLLRGLSNATADANDEEVGRDH